MRESVSSGRTAHELDKKKMKKAVCGLYSTKAETKLQSIISADGKRVDFTR